jgi:hypothetical protein
VLHQLELQFASLLLHSNTPLSQGLPMTLLLQIAAFYRQLVTCGCLCQDQVLSKQLCYN